MSNYRLYGDAKATARGVDVQRKQKALQVAREEFDASPGAKTGLALAGALFDVGRFDDAERLLKEALVHADDDIQVWFDLGFAYKNLNRKAEAIAAFQRVVELNPKHPLARGAEGEIWTLDPSYKPSWMRK